MGGWGVGVPEKGMQAFSLSLSLYIYICKAYTHYIGVL